MLTNNSQLNAWLWKWHVVAGLITLPFMLLLAVTGVVYMFKDDLNQQVYQPQYFVESSHGITLPLSQQMQAVQSQGVTISAVTLPANSKQTTAFKVAEKGRASNVIYVDPYTGELTGQIDHRETLMHTVSKLHGELLLGQGGTLLIEVVASWFIVLLITGICIWWPKKGTAMAGLLTIRFKQGKRMMWRDVHAVMGFWLSIFLLVIIAGGMPWTDVFGNQLKWVQDQTNSGYPQHWHSNKGLTSSHAQTSHLPISLDDVAAIGKEQALLGTLTIKLPIGESGVYTLSNRSMYLDNQQVLHIDQYSGDIVKQLDWDDVGVLMDMRQVFMRLHQGEYGRVNWYILLLVAITFIFTTVAGLLSYLARKRKGSWSIPQVPASFVVGKVLICTVIGLGVVFPMFGVSALMLYVVQLYMKRKTSNISSTN